MSSPRLFTLGVTCTLLLTATQAAKAEVRLWPGLPPCHNTLQNCLNGVNERDIVEIASDGIIDESLLIEDRLVSLRAGEGFHPFLAAGRDLIVDYSPGTTGLSVPFELTYGGLTLAGGRIKYSTTRTGSVAIEHMDITQGGAAAAINVTTPGVDFGSPTAITVRGNRIHTSLIANQAVIAVLNSPARVLIEDNLIDSQAGTPTIDPARTAIAVQGSTANAAVEIRRNLVVASVYPDSVAKRLRQGLVFSPGPTASFEIRVIDNLMDVGTQSSDIAVHGVVIGGDNVFDFTNNTIRSAGSGISLFDGSPALTALTARIRNNIIARPASVTARSGLEWQAGHPGISNDYNLLFNTANNTAPLGPNTVFADPQFQSVSDLRLKATSPAIDASDYLARSDVLPRLGLAVALDGDGLRRSVGAQVDLGAFEFGDTSFVHNASAAATSTTVARPGLDGNAGALMQITRSGGADSSTTAASAGPITQAYYLFTSLWSLLSDDGSTLPEGAGFTLLQSVPGGAAGTHVAVADNNFLGSGTSLGQQWSQLPADWVLLTSATRGIALDFSPNPHPFGAAFIDGAWRIINTDSANMPDNAMFVVHAQPPSHHAFRHTVSDANRITPVVSVLDHPDLNGIPCANPHISIDGNGVLPAPLVRVRYEPTLQRWYLLDVSPSVTLKPGNRYFVLIDPKLSADFCRGTVFGDGFE